MILIRYKHLRGVALLSFFLLLTPPYANGFADKIGSEGQHANLDNGAVSEFVTETFYKKNGYSKLDAEVGRNGVDGLYVKRTGDGGIKEVVFSEVKYGSSQLGRTWDGASQMSKKWKMDKIRKKIESLEKIPNPSKKQTRLIEELQIVERMLDRDDPRIKSHLTRVNKIGPDRYVIRNRALLERGTSNIVKGKKLSSSWNDVAINLNGTYKKGSAEWKLQKTLKHSIRKQKRMKKEAIRLKELVSKQNTLQKGTRRYWHYTKEIEKQKRLIRRIERSRPKIFGRNNKVLKRGLTEGIDSKRVQKALAGSVSVPAVVLKQGQKMVLFLDAKALKRSKALKKMKFLENLKGGDVVMMVLDAGVAVYSVLEGGTSFKQVSKSLLRNYGTEFVESAFTKGIAAFAAPPASTVIVIAASIAIDYGIDRYQEMNRKVYVGLEDVLWDIPPEIRNKITGFNLEDINKKTVFDFAESEGESIFDDENDANTVLEVKNESKSIFDMGGVE